LRSAVREVTFGSNRGRKSALLYCQGFRIDRLAPRLTLQTGSGVSALQEVWIGGPAVSFESAQATVLSQENEIRAMTGDIRAILPDSNPVLDPEFFLSSVNRTKWRPYVVVVRLGRQLAGAVYAKERLIGGIRTGLIYGDQVVGGMVVAKEEHSGLVVESAFRRLILRPGFRGLRIVLPPGHTGIGALEKMTSFRESAKLELSYSRANIHRRLSLPGRYETFLKQLGPTTRRNFRYYRRRSEQAGNTYCSRVDLDECRQAASRLASKCSHASDEQRFTRGFNMLEAVSQPILVGLRDKEGELVSLMAGWRHADSATLLFQLNNDRQYPRDSLSTVLRSYLIESLIETGVREAIFWGGTSGALMRYAEIIPGIQVYVDSCTFSWRLVRSLVASIVDSLPWRLRIRAQWVTAGKVLNLERNPNQEPVEIK
jgi:hypothetical protein